VIVFQNALAVHLLDSGKGARNNSLVCPGVHSVTIGIDLPQYGDIALDPAIAANDPSSGNPEISVVMPCLNEELTLAACIQQTQEAFVKNHISGEIIIADNGSTDTSRELAESLGARVVRVERKGYGSALMGGIAAARGKYIIMGDADCSYDFGHIPRFLEKLRSGYDLVMGNRFKGGIRPGAMKNLHRYLGNPVLTGIGRLFFKSPCGDFHCGLRGFSKAAYERMALRTTGMEFASEMVVKATVLKLPMCEVPTTLSPDGRDRPPHLRSWRDGWRHLRFLLLYSPRWLFLYPGMALMLAGLAMGLWLLPGPQRVGNVIFDIHTLLYAAAAVLTGFQAVMFSVFTKIFAITEGLLPEDPRLNKAFRIFTLEKGLYAGTLLLLTGLVLASRSLMVWDRAGFGPMDAVHLMREVTVAMVSLTLGVETILSSFFLSILGLTRK
jgi:glycosyltransferase involved in cell wall biosynthesis